ncbi:MAG TPA: DUF4349 domain-containing protein [Candidatus Acidoferrum sp.]|nr:DUF4349 domain-containing protein [Candidatus Acidoferrum sp.]
MSESSPRRSLPKRIVLILGGLAVFTLVFVIAIRLAVVGIFSGIEQNRATGLSAFSPFAHYSAASDLITLGNIWISRSAALQMCTASFDRSVEALHRIVASRHGYLEDLRTESRSGSGRTLSANVSVPASDFEAVLSEVKTLGRIETISEAGEDSAVKSNSATRHLAAAQTNLSRLQKLQRARKGELRDAVALEKDIAQANEAVIEAERQSQGLVSTVAQAHIRLVLLEDYRAPLQANLAGLFPQLRNSLVEGVSSIFSSAALVLGVLLEFGLPLLFWAALLFVPARFAWRRFRRVPEVLPVSQ